MIRRREKRNKGKREEEKIIRREKRNKGKREEEKQRRRAECVLERGS